MSMIPASIIILLITFTHPNGLSCKHIRSTLGYNERDRHMHMPISDRPYQHMSISERPYQHEKPKNQLCSYGFCENVADYPIRDVNNLLKSAPRLTQYLGPLEDLPPDVDNRNQFAPDEEICSTRKITKYPQKATNTKNEERFIINTEEYKQGVDYFLCHKEGEACKLSEFFPNYVSKCKQKYVVRRLMVLESNGTGKIFDDFPVPSCCVCMITQN